MKRGGDSGGAEMKESNATTNLGVHHHTLRLFPVRRLVKIYRADPVRVAHDRYARAVLDLAHQRIAPARYDQIDVSVLREQRRHFRARLDGLYERLRERGAREGGLDRAR